MSPAPHFDATPYALSEEQLRDIFDNDVRHDVFRRVQARQRDQAPVAVLLGAQPGAGKSRAMNEVRESYPGRHFAEIVGDDLRLFHPDYQRFLDTDPAHMPDITAQASGAWVRMSIEYARQQGLDVIIEGTFRNPALPITEAERFKVAGFDTRVVALAVPEVVSRASTLDRFVEGMRSEGFARWTPLEAHELGWAGVPQAVLAAAASEAVDRVTIINRAGKVLADEYHADGIAKAPAALEAGRYLPFDSNDADRWLRNFHQQVRYLHDERLLVPAMVPLLSRLADDAAELGTIATQPNSTPRNAAATKLRNTRELIDSAEPDQLRRSRVLEQRVTVLANTYAAPKSSGELSLQERMTRLQGAGAGDRPAADDAARQGIRPVSL